MKCYYDFHVHTALSPCGHEDMSPNNIINMAKLCDVNAIAITDHNSCENVEAVMRVAIKNDILVIPGMEIETREEIHVITLFPRIEDVYNMQKLVYKNLPNLKNKQNIFGKQIIFDEEDKVIRLNDRFLSTAVNLSIDEVIEVSKSLNGVAMPAHIDRPSYSILSNLGFIPEAMELTSLEISKYADYDSMKTKYNNYTIIQSSDAHDLESMVFNNQYIEVNKLDIEHILDYLKQG